MRPSIITIIIASGMLALVVMQVHAMDMAQSPNDDIRVEYDNGNAPQFVVFRAFLSGLSHSRKDKDQSRNYFLRPGMTVATNPNELFDYFMMIYEQIESEVSESTKRMLRFRWPSI